MQPSGWAKIKKTIDGNEKVVTVVSTAIIAVFTIALVLATILLYLSSERAVNAAKSSADIARETLVASSRPWLSILPPSVDGQLTWEEKGARVTVSVTIKNVGKGPAFDIAAEVDQFVLGPETLDIGAAIAKFCADVRRKQIERAKSGQHGEVLFPDETLPQKHGLLFARAVVEERANDMGGYFSPGIVICVDYRSPITKESHATGLAYLVLKRSKPGQDAPQALKPDETLNPSEFGLARSPVGSMAN